jgi:hypothetical protein
MRPSFEPTAGGGAVVVDDREDARAVVALVDRSPRTIGARGSATGRPAHTRVYERVSPTVSK